MHTVQRLDPTRYPTRSLATTRVLAPTTSHHLHHPQTTTPTPPHTHHVPSTSHASAVPASAQRATDAAPCRTV